MQPLYLNCIGGKSILHEIVDEGIHSTERFLPSSLFREKVKKTIQFTLKQIDKNLLIYRDLFPAPASKNGFYGAVKNEGWTASFWTGMLWLAYELTSDKKYRDAAEIQLKSFQSRLEKNISMETHDIGFLYTLSCVAATKLTKNTEARRTAIKAANRLLGRYLQKAGIIQAWGSLSDPKTSGCMIIDCLMNLPLLYWASEESGDRKYAEAAYQHAKSTAQYIVRPDASTYHTFYMDIETGKPKYGKTRQGYSDTSCWSRGQGSSIYGFSLSYAYTKDPAFLDIAGKTANYFLNRLPEDNICCWDLIFTD
ncbi:MAG TPA: glucuronyl hydrolase, partial [Clostridiales bacterium]|nr:glucuronyl hydrolase [Clostridiales bacterium]